MSIKIIHPRCFSEEYASNFNVVYNFSCGRYNATNYGKTGQHLNIRVGEHSSISLLNGKKSKVKTTTAIKVHMLLCDQVVSLEDFKILASSNSEFHLNIKESLLIAQDKPELNRNEKSLPLYLFDSCILPQILYLCKVSM